MPSSRNTLDAYTSTRSRTRPSSDDTDRPALLPSDVPQRDLDGAASVDGDPLIAEAAPGEQAHAIGERLDGADRLADEQRREHVVDDGRRAPTAYEQP